MEKKLKPRPQTALLLGLWSAVFAWLAAWVFTLGPALINDEYAAIDYFYRIVRGGHFYPTPDKLHKPLSVLLGFFAWATESPLGYELVIAASASAFIALLYLVARRELGDALGLLLAILVGFHPDLMYYSVTGSTVMPFCALAFLGLLAALRREEGPRWLWVYAASFLLAGLLRPESWLFAAPLVLWWRPRRDDRAGWVRLLVAGAVIALGPVIWFGKDWFINGDFLHGIKVAVRDKTVGMGAPFTALTTLDFFRVRIANIVSWPVASVGVLGAVWFARERGWKNAIIHPLLVFPLLVGAYVWLIVYQGVYPVQRYWYFDSVFALLFGVFFVKKLLRPVTPDPAAIARTTAFWAALLSGLGAVLAFAPDGWHLLVAAALFAIAAVVGLLWPRPLCRPWPSFLRPGLALFLLLSFVLFSQGYYARELAELDLETAKQAQMTAVADYLRPRLAPGDRLLLPSRRNEQLSWLFRDRAMPEAFFFREAFYLNYFRGTEFLDLHPDWIVYLDGDFQFFGPQKMFGWLQRQDLTEIGGVKVRLVFTTALVRVFRVEYPPGHPPKRPLPPIP